MKYFHLNDSTKMPERGSDNYDKLYKIRPVLDQLSSPPTYLERISVDESMIGFKGRLSWIQYMSKKPTKWGIIVWVAADSVNGYVWNLHLYTGEIIVTYEYIIYLIYRRGVECINGAWAGS